MQRASFSQWFLPAFMLVSSITLLVIGVPRFLAELMLVPGNPIYEEIFNGTQVSDEDLTVLEESRLSAIGFVEMPKAYVELGASYLIRAQRAQSPEEKIDYAKKSIEVTTTGLQMAPLNTFAWARIASANILLGPDYHDEAVVGWRNSVATARFEPFLLLQRLHIGIFLFNSLTEEDKQTLRDQAAVTFRWDRRRLRNFSKEKKMVEWVVFLMQDNPEAQAYLQE